MLLLGPAWLLATGQVRLDGDWRSADHSSSQLASDPIMIQEAIVQVYAARAFTWRGLWGVHMWIAAKPAQAGQYTVYQNIGWLAWRGLPVVSVRQDIPDRLWYNQRPWVVAELRGEDAARAIEKTAQASVSYPYQNNYSIWAGAEQQYLRCLHHSTRPNTVQSRLDCKLGAGRARFYWTRHADQQKL